MEFWVNFSIENLIQAVGLLGIFAIIFAESGILIGFFLPGDSLLFTAGFLASQGLLNISLLVLVSFTGAVLGDSVGYAMGKKFGPAIFRRDDSLVFSKENLSRAKNFYEKYGGKTIILARFMPVIRTFAPILAGVGEMRYRTFLAFNVIGGGLWAGGLTLLGYTLGNVIPNVDRYIIPMVGAIILISFMPGLFNLLGSRKRRAETWSFLKSLLAR